MRILITGAYGFIGSQITATLSAAGHDIVCCVRDVAQAKKRFPHFDAIQCDFSKDIQPDAWRDRLEGIDAVVNCVGILQSRKATVIDKIHYQSPRALFEACAEKNIKVIHLSAIGADKGVETPYAQTKLKLEQYLLKSDGNWIILRPSLVYASGSYGGTSLFRALASLPWIIPIVGSGKQLFQPIHMHDLAQTVKIAVEDRTLHKKSIDVVGPSTISVEQLFVQLREWLGFGPGKVIHIPLGIIRCVSFLGDWFKDIPINTTTYKMLSYNNVGDGKALAKYIGIKPLSFAENLAKEPSSTQDRWHARLYFLNPLLRLSIGLLWLLSGLIPLLSPASHATINQLFYQLGMSDDLSALIFYGSTTIDVLLGLLTLMNWKLKWVGSIQIAMILFYTTALSILAPALWLDPLGAIVKNIPLIIATLVMMVLSEQR